MKKQTAVPLGLVMSPMAPPLEVPNSSSLLLLLFLPAPPHPSSCSFPPPPPQGEYPTPIVDLGALGPVRCLRCKVGRHAAAPHLITSSPSYPHTPITPLLFFSSPYLLSSCIYSTAERDKDTHLVQVFTWLRHDIE